MSKYTFEELREYLSNETFEGENWKWFNDYRIEEETVAVSNYARAFSFIDGHFLKDQGENQAYMYWYINLMERNLSLYQFTRR